MKTEKWTKKNIPSLEGKTIIVTGGNSGLGYQSVKAFADKGAQVVMTCRNLKKGEKAKHDLLKLNHNANIIVMHLDLMDMASIRKFASDFKQNHKNLHILLNNAGIMMVPYRLTKDGIESQQATNHFGHYVLTALLLENLKNTPGSRVVNVSSMAHRSGDMNFENLLYVEGKDYTPMKAYGRSKLENLLFTYELQRFFETNKIDSIAVAAHPGVSDTNLFSHVGGKFIQKIFKPIFSFFVQPPSMGALPQLRAAVDIQVKGGEYYGPDGRREMKGHPVVVEASKAANDKQNARKLWEISAIITGVKF
ncbi:MAG TPA: oxidoreductase [Paludibacter sp.]|nr:oxidoreductase [Paludibacter sp.]